MPNSAVVVLAALQAFPTSVFVPAALAGSSHTLITHAVNCQQVMSALHTARHTCHSVALLKLQFRIQDKAAMHHPQLVIR